MARRMRSWHWVQGLSQLSNPAALLTWLSRAQHGAADAELDSLAERVRSIRGASGLGAEEGVLLNNGRQRPDLLDD